MIYLEPMFAYWKMVASISDWCLGLPVRPKPHLELVVSDRRVLPQVHRSSA